jgi:hypothetical protein
LNHDALETDNTAYFRFGVRPPARVLLMSNTPGISDPHHDAFYLWRALRAVASGSPQGGMTSDLAVSAPQGAAVSTVVIVPSEWRQDTASAESLRRFIESGGGALMFLSENPDDDRNIESILFHDGLRIMREKKPEGGTTARLAGVQYTHPIFSPMEEKGVALISGTRFRVAARLNPVSADVRVLARLSDGTPWIVETALKNGRVIMIASGLDPDTTNFALTPYFPALIARAADYLAGRPETEEEVFRVDDTVRLNVPKAGDAERLVAALRGGGASETLFRAGGRGEFRFTGNGGLPPGVYDVRLSKSGRRVAEFAVNPDPVEGRLSYISESELRRRLARLDIRIIPAGSDVYAALRRFSTENRFNRLWLLFLLGALTFLALDAALSNRD